MHDALRARPLDRGAERGRERRRCPGARRRGSPSTRSTPPATVFIGGLPMKRATNRLAGRVVDVLGRADLLEHALVDDRDAVAHRHRLDLVVGDVDDRRLEPALQLDELGAGLHPQLGVEVRQRLVHQERLRPPHDRPGERDPLALPARELRGLAVEQVLEAERSRPPRARARLALGRRRPCATRSGNSMFRRTVMCG